MQQDRIFGENQAGFKTGEMRTLPVLALKSDDADSLARALAHALKLSATLPTKSFLTSLNCQWLDCPSEKTKILVFAHQNSLVKVLARLMVLDLLAPNFLGHDRLDLVKTIRIQCKKILGFSASLEADTALDLNILRFYDFSERKWMQSPKPCPHKE